MPPRTTRSGEVLVRIGASTIALGPWHYPGYSGVWRCTTRRSLGVCRCASLPAALEAQRAGDKHRVALDRMTAYTHGRLLEWEIRRALEDDDWIVARSAGSHGLWDLCAVRKQTIRFIQAKWTTVGGRWRDTNVGLFAAMAAQFAGIESPITVQCEIWIKRGRSKNYEIITL